MLGWYLSLPAKDQCIKISIGKLLALLERKDLTKSGHVKTTAIRVRTKRRSQDLCVISCIQASQITSLVTKLWVRGDHPSNAQCLLANAEPKLKDRVVCINYQMIHSQNQGSS